jgi:hypothetical protein
MNFQKQEKLHYNLEEDKNQENNNITDITKTNNNTINNNKNITTEDITETVKITNTIKK